MPLVRKFKSCVLGVSGHIVSSNIFLANCFEISYMGIQELYNLNKIYVAHCYILFLNLVVSAYTPSCVRNLLIKIFLYLGRGDTIYSEDKSSEIKARAVANVIVQTPSDIHYIEWSDLTAIFKMYPVFREDFLARMVFAYQIGHHKKVCLI